MASLSAYYPLPVVAGTTAGTYAEGDHSHELDELDASGIAAGKVLTANGLDAASWEDSTGQVEEAPEDGIPYARKDADWTPTVGLEEDGSIKAIVQVRQGTAAELGEIVLNDGEIAVELEGGVPKQLKVGDGVTAGGIAPSINDWIIVEGTSGDNQLITNSSTLELVNFFNNVPALDVGSLYEFFGVAEFYIDTAGGGKISAGSNDRILYSSFVSVSGDWGEEKAINWENYQTEESDTGVLKFNGYAKVTSSELAGNPVAPLNKFYLAFAQKTATGDGSIEFIGSNSYIAYRKIA
jgi:hypothetical protein